MIEIRAYTEDDYMKIQRRHFDALTFMNFPKPELVAKKFAKGIAYTIEVPEGLVASGGVLPLWKGVGEAWVVTSELVETYPILFAKTVWKKLYEIINANGIERVQTTIHKDHVISQRWAERMGFENEGLMKKYLGGEDYYRYALIKEM
ncbi:unnamed protein product [marine sediment metagenome]|uniref:N-acetyltransferase domain-containing protein n=1 Tax=marine sediment metagenome TaxID=412755 RepID=X1FLT9_9ZZZZ